MKKIFILIVCSLLILPIKNLYSQHTTTYSSIEYIENQGQWQAPFLFKGTTPKGDIYLKKEGFRVFLSDEENHNKVHGLRHGWIHGVQTLKYHTFDILFSNSNPEVELSGEKPQKHYYNYYLGNKQENWKSGIHPVMAVNYTNLYNGIDAHVYSEEGSIKYDLIVHPGGDVKDIALNYVGLDNMKMEDGKLILTTSLGEIKEAMPYCFQNINGEKKEVKCNFVVKDNHVSFNVGKGYNPDYDLTIDPVLVFCTFTGSTADNWGYTATYDSLGNFYAGGIVGYQTGGSFIGAYPTTTGAFQTTFGGGGPGGMGNLFQYDAAISKFNSNGNALLFSTYLGGIDNDQPHSLIVDNNDNLVVAGRTYSNNFPTTTGCYDATFNGGADIFVCKFNTSGTSMLGGTYVGGSGDDCVNISADENTITANDLKHNYGDDARSEVIVDNNNNIYVTSSTASTNFPTVSPFQASNGGGQDAVIIELNTACTNLLWSSYLGGSANDAGYVISLNKTNQTQLFIAGGTSSNNFPTTPSSLHPSYQGGIADGFLMKFNASTKALMASTYIGTNQYDQTYGVQTDDSDYVFVMGQTTGAYPVVGAVYSNPNSSQYITKLNNNISTILRSTVFGTGSLGAGGSQLTDISPNAFLVDKCENIYVSGWGGPIILNNPGTTTGLPVTPATAIKSTTDGSDFYFIVFTKNLQSFLYGSFFGQNGGPAGEHVDGGTSRFDKNGVIYQAICAACGASTIFPTTAGAYATTNGSSNCNLAALKIDFQLQNPNADAQASGNTLGCAPFTVQFINNSTSAVTYVWDFGDGTGTSTAISPSHTFTNAGTFNVKLYATNPNGCTISVDSTVLTIIVKNDSIHANFNYVRIDTCGPFTASFTNTSTNTGTGVGTSYVWDFGDGSAPVTGANPANHNFPSATTYTVTLTMTDTNACNTPSVITKVIDFNTSFVTSDFDAPDSVCMPAIINFTDQSTNATSYGWNFGDGNTSTASNPTNTYTNTGVFTVTLVANNPNTCNKTSSSTKTINVFPSPVAEFSWTPNPPTPNTPNTFTNLSTGATSYLWNFGDGATSTNKDEVHIYQKDGDYDVCLTAKNDFGCIDTTCKKVRGVVIPLVDVPSGFSPNGDGVNDIVYVKGYGIATMLFRIYNRWGEKVFESTNQSYGWDGRYKSEIQEMEVYGYTLNVTFFDGTKDSKKGNITLLK